MFLSFSVFCESLCGNNIILSLNVQHRSLVKQSGSANVFDGKDLSHSLNLFNGSQLFSLFISSFGNFCYLYLLRMLRFFFFYTKLFILYLHYTLMSIGYEVSSFITKFIILKIYLVSIFFLHSLIQMKRELGKCFGKGPYLACFCMYHW